MTCKCKWFIFHGYVSLLQGSFFRVRKRVRKWSRSMCSVLYVSVGAYHTRSFAGESNRGYGQLTIPGMLIPEAGEVSHKCPK